MTDTPTTAALRPLTADGRELLFTDARTANTFTDTPVAQEQLLAAWDLAKWAPTSANTQPLRIQFVSAESRDRLVPHMHEMNRAKTAAAPAVAVLAVDTSYHERIPELLPGKPELAELLESNPPLRAATGDFSAALQAGYFILAVRAVGLAAGPMGGFDHAGIDEEFFSETPWRSTLVINIGHPGPDAWQGRLPRLDPSDVIRWA